MEFLKSVPAVKGRFVVFVMCSAPSGHMPRRTWKTSLIYEHEHHLPCLDNNRVFGVEEEPLEVLEESVPVLLNKAADVVNNVAGVVLHLIIRIISGRVGDNEEEDSDLEVFLVGKLLVCWVRPGKRKLVILKQIAAHC